jgi:hypothetical protein
VGGGEGREIPPSKKFIEFINGKFHYVQFIVVICCLFPLSFSWLLLLLFCFVSYYGLNVCPLQNSCWKFTAIVTALRCRTFKKWLGHDIAGSTFMDVIDVCPLLPSLTISPSTIWPWSRCQQFDLGLLSLQKHET